MATHIPKSQHGEYEWTKGMSTNGIPIEVGIRHHDPTEAQSESVTGEKNPFVGQKEGVKVNWEIGEDEWKSTSGLVSKKPYSITQYNLTRSAVPGFDYVLTVTTHNTGIYKFKDESGDEYSLTVAVTGDHSVRYSSPKPTIVKVSM